MQVLLFKAFLTTGDPGRAPMEAADIVLRQGGALNINGKQVTERNELIQYLKQQNDETMPMTIKELGRLGISGVPDAALGNGLK